MSEPNKWHRIGVVMSLISLVVSLVAAVVIVGGTTPGWPNMWQSTTRHSDRPSQVIEGIRGLEAEIDDHRNEIDWRVKELQDAQIRALHKAAECREGRGEEGETVDEAKRAELVARAREWEAAAKAAEAAVLRLSARR
jgi:hypothetical protein